MVHMSALLSLVRLFVDGEAISGNYRADFVLFLLTTDAEHLVVNLNRYKVFRQDLCVAESNLLGRLGYKLMDHHLIVGAVIIVQAWLVLTQNEIRLKADHIVEEPAELVDFRANNDIWARVVGQVSLMLLDFYFQDLTFLTKVSYLISEL